MTKHAEFQEEYVVSEPTEYRCHCMPEAGPAQGHLNVGRVVWLKEKVDRSNEMPREITAFVDLLGVVTIDPSKLKHL